VPNSALAVRGPQGHRIFRLYHLYRLIIGVVLVLLVSANLDSELLELAHASLFRGASWVYLSLNILVALTIHTPNRLLPVFAVALVT